MTLEPKNMLFYQEQPGLYHQWREELAEESPETADFFKTQEADGFVRAWINRTGSVSPYLTRLLFCEKPFVRRMAENGYYRTFAGLLKESFQQLYLHADMETAGRELRLLKRRAALVIAFADISGEWDMAMVTQALSVLAEACLRIAVSAVLREAARKGDLALKNPEQPEEGSGLIVLAMGKLGARELNYSSDIDLIVLYDEEKVPYTGKRDVGQFFVRLTKNLISLMDDKTACGYVFRTDLRLRPDPGSTPVALSTAAAACYYESFAQNWERAAFIKARAIAGDKQAGNAFLKEIRPFVWRRSTDFYALRQIHEIKRSLGVRSADAPDMAGYNVKLGQGGIREIEFFTQLQQLLWGGREVRLRSRGTLNALRSLTKAGWVKPQDRETLADAYVFLRTLEHRLQMVADEQTQTLPKTQEELDSLALFMGFETYGDFVAALRTRREAVRKIYDSLFVGTEGEEDRDEFIFSGTDVPAETARQLETLGFKDAAFIGDAVRGWRSGRYRALRSDRARELISELLPQIFKALSRNENADSAFACFDEFLKGLPAGVQLFSLFQSRPALLDLLAEVIGIAPSLAVELTRRPELFDAVLSPSFFLPFPCAAEMTEEAQNLLAMADGVEQVLDALRRFVREKRFRCAVLFLRGLIEKEAVGQCLTDIVSTVLAVLSPVVVSAFEEHYGHFETSRFSFILLGKAGSAEMSFTSDLDILFVYDVPADAFSEGGRSSLSPGVYYARLAQRFVNALTVNTREGILWPVDMRLRPSGNAGPAAASFEAFGRYYEESAWTWELMALTKARAAWGDKKVVETEIRRLLCRPRDEETLKKDVSEMREKVKSQFPAKRMRDVKYCDGGMVDIEFSAQYLQLKYASEYPDILQRSVRPVLKKAHEYGLISDEAYTALDEAYRLWSLLSVLFSVCLADTEDDIDAVSEDVRKKICSFCGVGDIADAADLIREKAENAALYRLF